MGGAQDLSSTFTYDDAGSHRVARNHAWHDGPICDAEVLDAIDLKLGIYNGHGVAPHLCRPARGIALDNKRPEITEIMGNNIFFDTCVYHQPGIDLLTKVVPIENILFASEMVGAVKGTDPRTGHYFDDTRRYIDGASGISAADRQKIYEGNAMKVYPRLKHAIERQRKTAAAVS